MHALSVQKTLRVWQDCSRRGRESATGKDATETGQIQSGVVIVDSSMIVRIDDR